jgi:tRNA A37 N6-isopentenylltransferase MiaA
MIANDALRGELRRIKDMVQQGRLRWNKGLLQAIGYREFEPFVTRAIERGVEDESLFAKGVEDLVRNTVKYAKKQSKWIKKIASMVDVVYVDEFNAELVETIKSAPPLRAHKIHS